MYRCAGGLWLQGHTVRASLLSSVGKIFHCVHYLSAAPRMIKYDQWHSTGTQCTEVRRQGIALFYIRKVLDLNADSDIGYYTRNSCFFSDTPGNSRSSASTRATIATCFRSVNGRSSHQSTLQATSDGNTVVNQSP